MDTVQNSSASLAAARKALGLTQRALEAELGFSRRLVESWESGKFGPKDWTVLEKYARRIGLDPKVVAKLTHHEAPGDPCPHGWCEGYKALPNRDGALNLDIITLCPRCKSEVRHCGRHRTEYHRGLCIKCRRAALNPMSERVDVKCRGSRTFVYGALLRECQEAKTITKAAFIRLVSANEKDKTYLCRRCSIIQEIRRLKAREEIDFLEKIKDEFRGNQQNYEKRVQEFCRKKKFNDNDERKFKKLTQLAGQKIRIRTMEELSWLRSFCYWYPRYLDKSGNTVHFRDPSILEKLIEGGRKSRVHPSYKTSLSLGQWMRRALEVAKAAKVQKSARNHGVKLTYDAAALLATNVNLGDLPECFVKLRRVAVKQAKKQPLARDRIIDILGAMPKRPATRLDIQGYCEICGKHLFSKRLGIRTHRRCYVKTFYKSRLPEKTYNRGGQDDSDVQRCRLAFVILRRAGWTRDKIAVEFEASEETVKKGVSDFLDRMPDPEVMGVVPDRFKRLVSFLQDSDTHRDEQKFRFARGNIDPTLHLLPKRTPRDDSYTRFPA